MTHYQKIALVVFRAVAVIILFVGLLASISGLIVMPPAANKAIVLIVFLPYFLGSAILFMASKFLAKLICFDLGDGDEQK